MFNRLDSLLFKILIKRHQLFVQVHQFAPASLFVDMCDNVQSKVENALKVTRREVQQETNAAGRSLKVPDVADWGSQFNVSHTLAAHFRTRHFYAALIADNSLKTHSFIFSAITLPVFGG